MIFDDTGLVAFLFEMSFKAGPASLAVAWAHSLVISIFGSDIKHELAQQFIEQRRRNFFLRSWSLPSSEEGFLSGLCLCWSLLWSFCFLAHPWSHLVSQGEQILALLPFCFERKPSACFPPLWRTTVCVSDWTKDEFSQSFAFLIGRLGIPYEFYADSMRKSQYVWLKIKCSLLFFSLLKVPSGFLGIRDWAYL